MVMEHPARNAQRCAICNSRPADRYIFTVVIRRGGNDATKRTQYVCGPCGDDATRWLEKMGLVVTDDVNSEEWDAVIQILDAPAAEGREAAGNAGRTTRNE